MPFNNTLTEYERPFSFVDDRAPGTVISRADLDAQFNDMAAALEVLLGAGAATLSTFGAVPAWDSKAGTDALLLRGGITAYDGQGGVYLLTTDTEQPHMPPLWLVDANGRRWRRLSPIVQESLTDATAGRLLQVGAFGLGGVLPRIGNAAVTSETIAPGFYSYDSAAGSSGGPAAVTKGMLWHTRRGTGQGETQMLLVEATTSDIYPIFALVTRTRSGGAWSEWWNTAQAFGAVVEFAMNLGRVDNGIQPGFYGYSTSGGSTGGPTGVTKGTVVWLRHPNETGETQLMVVEASTNPAYPVGCTTSRSRQNAGAWAAWWNPTEAVSATLAVAANISVTNNSIPSGFYSYIESVGSTGGPAGVAKGALWHARRSSGGGETQLMIVEESTEHAPGAILGRSRGTGGWGDWFPDVGSNGNGTYRRTADGRLECWRDIPASNRNADADLDGLHVSVQLTYPYPYAFSEEPDFAGASLKQFAFVNGFLVGAGGDATEWKLRYAKLIDWTGQNCPAVRLYATGRWT